MERGLLWLPLLVIFSWLAWSGWNEYQKVEAYQAWAKQFEKAKYDIYAVLGQNGNELTWGKPTPKGPIELKIFSLEQVHSINLRVDGHLVSLEVLPSRGHSVMLEFRLSNSSSPLEIPFTEISLAANWTKHLQQHLADLQCEKIE
jgi:hypothetical protein